MITGDVAILRADLQAHLENATHLNFHAQAHAQSILTGLAADTAEWPSFTPTLVERVHYSAHYKLIGALRLLDVDDTRDRSDGLAKRLLAKGAEALEFISQVGGAGIRTAVDSLVKAAVAYHIAGHHARSFVLTKEALLLSGESAERDPVTEIALALLAKDLLAARRATIEAFTSETSDDQLAASIRAGEMDATAAITAVLELRIISAASLFLEYAKSGEQTLLASSRAMLRHVEHVAREARVPDLWFWSAGLRHLLDEFGDASLWSWLDDFGPSGLSSPTLLAYVHSSLDRRPTDLTLWPSQRAAMPWVKDPARSSFCVCMPTSAGKTRIAELTILRALLDADDDSTRVIYIAPFRALATQVESSLRRTIQGLGFGVSELYGGFELTASDRAMIEATKVIIATPEKLDAVVRLAPETLGQVSLIVFDEGHLAADDSERGLHAELLVQRLKNRFPVESTRYVMLSAVLPDPDLFSRWISGSADKAIVSDWRPSRLMIGALEWNGTRVRIDYSHLQATALESPCFIPNFVLTREVRGIAGAGLRRLPFPKDAREAFAESSIRLAAQGLTLAFVPQARLVHPAAKDILGALKWRRVLDGEDAGVVPGLDTSRRSWAACIEAIERELGDSSPLLGYLDAGFIVHHSSLPQRVRLAIERLIQDGCVRLVVSTTTLASGVNLPIKNVAVRGLQQGLNKQVDPSTFWNIAGRAGRAMVENEGHVLFFVDETLSGQRRARTRRAIGSLIRGGERHQALGALYRLLEKIAETWATDAPGVSFDELCVFLANNTLDWAPEEDRDSIAELLGVLDKHLLAIEQEALTDAVDTLQEVMNGTLSFLQMEGKPIAGLSEERAVRVFESRLTFIKDRVPDLARRRQFYLTGLSIADCERLLARRDAINELLRRATGWDAADSTTRARYLIQLASNFVDLEVVREQCPEGLSSEDFLKLCQHWLLGLQPHEILEALGTGGELPGPEEVSRFVESAIVYSLSWVVGGAVAFLGSEDEGSDPLPVVCGAFPAMFKLGVCDAIATLCAPHLQLDRRLAMALGAVCPYGFDAPDRALAWFFNVDEGTLVSLGITESDSSAIVRLRNRRKVPEIDFESTLQISDLAVLVATETASDLEAGSRLLFVPTRKGERKDRFRLYKTTGQDLGHYRLSSGEVPEWCDRLDLTEALVTSRDASEEAGKVRVSLRVRNIQYGHWGL